MQDVTPWPESFDVSEPVARVLVDDVLVDVESVSISSELDSAMPERVAAGGGGVVAATGTARILRRDDVSEAGFNPWGDAQQFVNASEIVVEAGYREPKTGGVGCARQITAQVDSLDGGAASSVVGLEFVDHTPQLDRDITIEPLLQIYPPLEGAATLRGAGLYPTYITDRVLRHCGFYATPPIIEGAVFSAPMMGSAVPERGMLLHALAASDSTRSLVFRSAPWGMGLSDGVVRYGPDLSSRGHGRLTSTLHASFHLRRSDTNISDHVYFEMCWGSRSDAIRIQASRIGSVSIRYVQDGVDTLVATLSGSDVEESEAFTVLISPSGAATIYGSNGSVAHGESPLPSKMSTQSLDEIFVRVPPSSQVLGGLQVAFSDNTTHTFERTAHLDPPAYPHSLHAFPSKISVNCLDLLKDQAEAELSAMWIDERGHFRWRNKDRLLSTAPRATLTAHDDLLDLPWQVPAHSVFSCVELEYETATITRRRVPAITVHDGGGSVLSDGEVENMFIEPPADQDWHMVSTPEWVGGAINHWDLRRSIGSYRGGIVVDDDNNERLAYSSQLSQTWSQINPQRWMVSSEVHGLSSSEYIEQNLRDRPDLYGKFAGEKLPIIRAKGLVQWGKETITGTARGPSLAPNFLHKVGPWIQDANALKSLTDWLAEQLTKPDVILRSVPIVPDPRIQLGEVFWLEDKTAYQVRLRVVVMGKTLTFQSTDSGNEMTQTITCRVIGVERFGARYDELEMAWVGRDYEALESTWGGQNYAALEADPLDRS